MTEDYMKDIKESLYHALITGALSVGYTMLGKTIFKMKAPEMGKFDLPDMGKLVLVTAAADMTKDWLVRNKIIPPSI